MLDSLITSKTRLNLVLRFFANPKYSSYMRSLAAEFGESSNAIRVELNRLEKAKLILSSLVNNRKMYCANIDHPLYQELHSIVKKVLGLDQIVHQVLSKLGQIDMALVIGDYAKGIDSGIVDLVIVGQVDQDYMQRLLIKAEEIIKRKIRPLVLGVNEFRKLQDGILGKGYLVVWGKFDY